MDIKQEIMHKMKQLPEPFSLLDVIKIFAQFPAEKKENTEFKKLVKEITSPLIRKLIKQG